MLRAESTNSVVPPEFPKKRTLKSCNGLTRSSLLTFRNSAPGRQFDPGHMRSHQTRTLLDDQLKENSPSSLLPAKNTTYRKKSQQKNKIPLLLFQKRAMI